MDAEVIGEDEAGLGLQVVDPGRDEIKALLMDDLGANGGHLAFAVAVTLRMGTSWPPPSTSTSSSISLPTSTAHAT